MFFLSGQGALTHYSEEFFMGVLEGIIIGLALAGALIALADMFITD